MERQFVVYASTGKCMSEPFVAYSDAQAYADSLTKDFANDGTSFFVVQYRGELI